MVAAASSVVRSPGFVAISVCSGETWMNGERHVRFLVNHIFRTGSKKSRNIVQTEIRSFDNLRAVSLEYNAEDLSNNGR